MHPLKSPSCIRPINDYTSRDASCLLYKNNVENKSNLVGRNNSRYGAYFHETKCGILVYRTCTWLAHVLSFVGVLVIFQLVRNLYACIDYSVFLQSVLPRPIPCSLDTLTFYKATTQVDCTSQTIFQSQKTVWDLFEV